MDHRRSVSAHDASRVSRRLLLQVTAAGAASSAVILAAGGREATLAQEATPVGQGASRQFAYVGSDSRTAIAAGGNPAEAGISVFFVAPDTGALTLVQTVPSDNAFYFAFDPTRRFLYAVNVIGDYEGKESGSVEAYAVDPETGMLTFVNRQSSAGSTAAQPAVDPSGRYVVVANYNGANFVVLPINPDGSLEPVVNSLEQTGSGPNAERQDMSHPHAVVFDPGGNYIAAADLGTDQVLIFQLDTETGALERVSEASTAPGAGPRHVAFSPDGTKLYVVNEMGGTITLFAFDPATGTIGEELQTISTVPDPFEGTKSTAEILLHPSGSFLYNSNRGQPDMVTPEGDAIVAFAIDPESGELTLVGHTTEGIAVPWSFAFDAAGQWLYAANYDDDTITQFAIDQQTGALTPTGEPTTVPRPFVIMLSTP
ncbi:MAG: lactonase family protein [Chloroflexota bacterium]|nr:lactonase family protein [Chloroflexota bacterium]